MVIAGFASARPDAIAAVFGSGVAATWQQEPGRGGDLP
jgi:hypothetical protein